MARKETLVKKRKRKKIIAVQIIAPTLTLSFVFVIAVVLLIPSGKHPIRDSKSAGYTAWSPYTEKETQEFLDAHLQATITRILPSGKFFIPEIQARYNFVVSKINALYGVEHSFEAPNIYGHSKFVTVGVRISNGVPSVQLYMPSIMDMYRAGKGLGMSEETLQRLFVIDLMHELDHLAFGFLSDEGQAYSKEKYINNERLAWAETCEHTIRPMVETHRLRIEGLQLQCYRAWVEGGRNPENGRWKEFIGSLYRK